MSRLNGAGARRRLTSLRGRAAEPASESSAKKTTETKPPDAREMGSARAGWPQGLSQVGLAYWRRPVAPDPGVVCRGAKSGGLANA
eukprot:COSAG04_NODE_1287_length_7366_cov_18.273153_4_plen_86_part_00